ncbi:hypothetical protein ACFQ1M_07465 [Sungkyunkwania multivorans]|uniref:Lipocalin-like domain-containing protein n=1 Tax=Sungkyunkwania multivorans TaxID=1173618 RepID=A0ABW3CWC1_9FLAO
MKTLLFRMLLVVLSISLMSSTCSSDDDDIIDNSQEIAAVKNTAEDGTWRITSFVDSGQDETNDFNDYNFTFASDGTLTATNGSNTVTGTWSVTDDSNSSSSSSSDDIDFNIAFPVPATSVFEDLNDDWDIVSYSAAKISLIDISGGNGGTDTLVFEKN